MAKNLEVLDRRKARVRTSLKKVAFGRPRLSIFRSSKQIYAQIIDDVNGFTLASASSIDKDVKGSIKTGSDTTAAKTIGKLVAQRAKNAGITQVVFDRGAYLFHGRVKALAEGAREGGLDF